MARGAPPSLLDLLTWGRLLLLSDVEVEEKDALLDSREGLLLWKEGTEAVLLLALVDGASCAFEVTPAAAAELAARRVDILQVAAS